MSKDVLRFSRNTRSGGGAANALAKRKDAEERHPLASPFWTTSLAWRPCWILPLSRGSRSASTKPSHSALVASPLFTPSVPAPRRQHVLPHVAPGTRTASSLLQFSSSGVQCLLLLNSLYCSYRIHMQACRPCSTFGGRGFHWGWSRCKSRSFPDHL